MTDTISAGSILVEAGTFLPGSVAPQKQKALRTALKRLAANVRSRRCNTIEIMQVLRKSFLSVPYFSVSAHPRHLRKGVLFSG